MGKVLNGRFELLALIGSGAMGNVYSARDRVLGRSVALKVLSQELWDSERARERMAREAAALGRIHHPNVVGIHDVFEEGEALVLALELVTGGTLADRLRQGPFPLDQALGIMDAVLAGLEAIHREGVVHRDMKPANVLLTEDGTPKIADLGVARDATAKGLTAAGAQLGTLEYMSPEQILGREIGPTTDIYACGVVTFELLTGTLPFSGRTDFEVMGAHLNQSPNLGALQACATASVAHVIARALAKAPAQRWPSAPELRAALGEARRSAAAVVPVLAAAGGLGRTSERASRAKVPRGDGLSATAPMKGHARRRSGSGPRPDGRNERRHRSRSRRHRSADPIGPGTLLANAFKRSTSEPSGFCLPILLVLAAAILIVGMLVTAAIVFGVFRLGGNVLP
ncbi:MAG: serine/threonine protein kinase [Polyangiaceae bacterium]|nr:serine/threonine protein kinase [Polyangiaceae bacterium]